MNKGNSTRDGTLPPGEQLGRYEVIAPIARGGMGAVYLARAAGAGGFSRLFAVKVMHAHLADEAEFVHMLVDEARVASRIHHPNAVAILDVGESPHGYYLVMDYVDGTTLSRVRSSRGLDDTQKTRIGLRALLDALTGLHSAHELTDDEGNPLHIVHRDVSPHNILIGADGVARITDFGIALAVSRIASSRPGMIKGKPQYMAPEQVLAKPVDARADVFCAGIILWEFLTRGRLFKADNEAAALMQVCNAQIVAPSSLIPLPSGFDDVCMRALDRNVDGRFPTARAFAEALEKVTLSAGWNLSTHEVSELIRSAFADEIAQRRTLVRERARATGQSPGDSISTGRVAGPVPAPSPPVAPASPLLAASDSFQGAETLAAVSSPSRPGPLPQTTAGKDTSHSLPAIEVGATPARAAETVRLSATPSKPTSTPRAAAAVVAVAVVAGLVAWRVQPSGARAGSSATQPATSPVRAPEPPRPAPPTPTTAPTPTPPTTTLDPGPPTPPSSFVDPSPVVTPPARSQPAAPPRARTHRRGERDGGTGATSDPAIETNPYLRR